MNPNNSVKCAAIGCRCYIPRGRLMCFPHWAMLPADLKRRISISYKAVKRNEPGAVIFHRTLVREAMGFVRNYVNESLASVGEI